VLVSEFSLRAEYTPLVSLVLSCDLACALVSQFPASFVLSPGGRGAVAVGAFWATVDVGVFVGVAEVPRLVGFECLATSPTSAVTALYDGQPGGTQSLVVAAVAFDAGAGPACDDW
jgi:hypothetical protein